MNNLDPWQASTTRAADDVAGHAFLILKSPYQTTLRWISDRIMNKIRADTSLEGGLLDVVPVDVNPWGSILSVGCMNNYLVTNMQDVPGVKLIYIVRVNQWYT